MKKVIAGFALCALSAMAADFTGTIMDAKCSTNKAMRDNAACIARCIKGGEAAVLVTDEGKIYKIAEQDKIVAHAGHNVTITGDLNGDTISITKVTMNKM
jgi:hypothetical protein